MGNQLYSPKYKHWKAKKSKVILVIMCVCALLPSRVPLFDTLWTVTIRLLCPWDFPSKNTCSVVISYFRISSWTRNWTSISCIFCIGGWIFYHHATWEAPLVIILFTNLATHVNSHLYMKIMNLSLIYENYERKGNKRVLKQKFIWIYRWFLRNKILSL